MKQCFVISRPLLVNVTHFCGDSIQASSARSSAFKSIQGKSIRNSHQFSKFYQKLNMNEGSLKNSSGQLRVRQHVNPLKNQYQVPLVLPGEWPSKEVFEDPSRAFHVDLGTAKGRFALSMAEKHPDKNFLGVEIRHPLVVQANRWREEMRLNNVEFLTTNANVSLATLLVRLPSICCISIQFPDPHWKKRHQKRRIVQPDLVELIAQHCGHPCQIYLASDVREVAEEMVQVFMESGYFERYYKDEQVEDKYDDGRAWLKENPFDVPTEREIRVLERGLPVYREMLLRSREESTE